MNYENFTIKTQEALQEASSIANKKDNSEIGTEHVLLALLEQQDGLIVPIVERIGISVNEVINKTKAIIDSNPKVTGLSQVYFSSEFQKILAKAEDEMNAKALEAKAMKWEFDETSKAGKGEHSANVTTDEMNAKALEAAAKKWAFSGQSKAGGGTQSAKHPEKELSIKEMTDRAVKYPPKKSAADIAKFLSKKKK